MAGQMFNTAQSIPDEAELLVTLNQKLLNQVLLTEMVMLLIVNDGSVDIDLTTDETK